MSVVLVGLGLSVVGLVVLVLASRSPHGYIEVFVGLPLVLAGTLTVGVALARLKPPILRAIGWLVLIAVPVAVALLLATA